MNLQREFPYQLQYHLLNHLNLRDQLVLQDLRVLADQNYR
jgi:hypothetical protein